MVVMSQKPILMTPPNIVAIDELRKTMTRRLCKVQPPDETYQLLTCISTTGDKRNEGKHCWAVVDGLNITKDTDTYFKAPYAVGDELWIKEPHYRYGKWARNGLAKKTKKPAWAFKSYGELVHGPELFDFPGTERGRSIHPVRNTCREWAWYKRSPLFMPKAFARKWLRVTNVKAPERVQDITRSDIRAEGLMCPPELGSDDLQYNYKDWYVDNWILLWDSIHGPDSPKSWKANPWVFPIEFEKIQKG